MMPIFLEDKTNSCFSLIRFSLPVGPAISTRCAYHRDVIDIVDLIWIRSLVSLANAWYLLHYSHGSQRFSAFLTWTSAGLSDLYFLQRGYLREKSASAAGKGLQSTEVPCVIS